MLSLSEKDRARYCPPRFWKVGEVALSKLPNQAKSFWPLVRVLETVPDENKVVCAVKVLEPDPSEVVVNVDQLISLQLYFELDNHRVYSDNFDNSAQEEDNLEGGETLSEIDVPVVECATARPTRRTDQASKAQSRVLASRGLV